MPRLTPKGKRAEERLAALERYRVSLGNMKERGDITYTEFDSQRDRVDAAIDHIESNFADPEDSAAYFTRVRGSYRSSPHTRRLH